MPLLMKARCYPERRLGWKQYMPLKSVTYLEWAKLHAVRVQIRVRVDVRLYAALSRQFLSDEKCQHTGVCRSQSCNDSHGTTESADIVSPQIILFLSGVADILILKFDLYVRHTKPERMFLKNCYLKKLTKSVK
ncbi:hypothetical protein TNCV_2347211 [Trichonephila clavipes]|nr:hypothetical protein TNCV_2347211 [Trichonephila clavipes]